MSSKTATNSKAVRPGSIVATVHDKHTDGAIANAAISLYTNPGQTCDAFTPTQWSPDAARLVAAGVTDGGGAVTFAALAPGAYVLVYEHFPVTQPVCVEVDSGCASMACFQLDLNTAVTMTFETPECQPSNCRTPRVMDRALAMVSFNGDSSSDLRPHVQVVAPAPWAPLADDPFVFTRTIRQTGNQGFDALVLFNRRSIASPGLAMLSAADAANPAGNQARLGITAVFAADERVPTPVAGNIGVSMTRTETEPTEDLPLWTLIRNSTEAMSFTNYLNFMDSLFCTGFNNLGGFEGERFGKKADMFQVLRQKRALPFTDSDAYRVLKVATEAFVMVNCGVLSQPLAFNPAQDQAYLDRRDIPPTRDLETVFNDEYLESVGGTKVLPYLAIIRRKLPDVAITLPHGQEEDAELCFGIVQKRLAHPCLLELIWSYWQEEGMLVQTMNAITQRFQNVRTPHGQDPLANLEIDPLRPLNNLIWGYTQDEQHRLTVVRRNYEYDHHYGLRLDGKAINHFRPADSRSKFLEAFHYLLRLCTVFYRQDDDTTVKADAFPVLNALKEIHLVLSQGAHNQFGDLPSTARIEMMMQQWMLARPEFREFIPTRIMVAYPEPWMDRVDAMKKLQGWSDTSVMQFRNLAIFGEQVLLSVRYGNWSDIYEPTQAFNWARFWRPQIQGYIHAYRAATGVDLSGDGRDPKDGQLPATLLRERLDQQVRSA
jgi:hypothetical protein